MHNFLMSKEPFYPFHTGLKDQNSLKEKSNLNEKKSCFGTQHKTRHAIFVLVIIGMRFANGTFPVKKQKESVFSHRFHQRFQVRCSAHGEQFISLGSMYMKRCFNILLITNQHQSSLISIF